MNLNSKKIATYIFVGLVAFVFIATGIQKLFSLSDEATLAAFGGKTKTIILATMQLIFAVLFLIPRTALIGTLFMIAYMGGAIAVHFMANEDILLQVGIQTLIWVTAFMRFPELCQRLCSGCSSCKK